MKPTSNFKLNEWYGNSQIDVVKKGHVRTSSDQHTDSGRSNNTNISGSGTGSQKRSGGNT